MTEVAPLELTRAEVRERIARAAAERDRGMAWAEMAEDERGGWTRALVDQAIAWFAQTGDRFSANDLRELLPDDLPLRGLMGSRFQIAARTGVIRAVAWVPSTKENTHTKPIYKWIGAEFLDLGGEA